MTRTTTQRRAVTAVRQETSSAGRGRRGARPTSASRSVAVIGALGLLALTGCSVDGLLNSDKLPSSVTDPAIIKTRDGALQAYRGTTVAFRQAIGGGPSSWTSSVALGGAFGVVEVTGELTDELQNTVYTDDVSHVYLAGDPVDRRELPEGFQDPGPYPALQKVRGQVSQAIGLLHDYAPEDSALAGHAYALAGYAEVLLAELYCSGIPLSTLDYNGDYTLKPGSSTADVLNHASALFDTALTLAADSLRFMDLARIGKGRALLSLGNYVQAAAAVGAVEDGYVYKAYFGNTTIDNGGQNQDDQRNFVVYGVSIPTDVADREGLRGLDYIASGDPRTAVEVRSRTLDNGHTVSYNLPAKYAPFDGSSPIVLASGLEARLIEAEAALQAKDYAAWLDKLNYLRQTETFWGQIVPNPGGPLPALDDPGATISDPAAADSARVDLLFRERAFWLFLTGHRQGDLRRLIHWYGRKPADVYPSGPYPAGSFYGGDVTLPVPVDERNANSHFTGCASRSA